MRITLFSGLALACVSSDVCSAQNNSAFFSPELKYRPRFRYWLPDASVPSSIVQQDIAAITSVGAGGFELLAYYQYGFPESDRGLSTPTDWSEYGFGTEAFRQIFLAALEATDEHGISMDFALGANQGQGCPAEPESHGLAVELAYSNITVAPGSTFNGKLPLSLQPNNLLGSIMHKLEDFGQQNLSAVVAVEIKARVESPTSYPSNVLGQVIDLTSSVRSDRSLNWTAPAGNSTWRLISWYDRYTNQKSVAPGLNATNYVQNGSWVVDHFSATGSRKMTDFFDQHVIPDGHSRKLLAAAGSHGWEDSLEMQSALWWTPEFPRMFQEGRGYSIVQCLPFLITTENYWIQAIAPYGEVFTSSNQSLADRCNQDYRMTLNEGYQQYLSHYVEWAHSRGIKYSAQPAYNLPLNMLDDVPLLDAPEGESLGFNNIIDTYRQLTGPAHISGNSFVSSECGALDGAPYTQTVNDLLWSVRRGLATGISMNILHGFAYSGPYANTTWPSYTTFTYRYTEMWNQHQPSWRHFNDTIMYIARNQYVSQIGTPKLDLAFYQYSSPWLGKEQYRNDNLERLGYTYEYLGPGVLTSKHAVVRDGMLASSGPAYKALIFSNQTLLTPEVAAKIKEFALDGLPIFFVGTTVFTSIGRTPGHAQNVSSTMNEIISNGTNVHAVTSAEKLPDALEAASILPKTSFSTPMMDWYTFWRKGEGMDYVFLYNDGNETRTSEVRFNASGTPYSFDAWTGSVSPVLQYSPGPSSISVPVTLVANQTVILGFATSGKNSTSGLPPSPKAFITSTSGAVKGLRYNGTSILAQISGPASVVLSSGETLNLTASPPAASNLTTWDIAIEDWHSTNDTFSMDTAVNLHTYKNATLAPWLSLDPALVSVGGIGTYSTQFAYPAMPRDEHHLGALLHLGPIVNTVRVWLNGLMLPPVDVSDAVVDVTEYLQPGNNKIEVEVASTLFNRIKASGNATWTAGVTANEENSRFYENSEYKEFGLVGPVWIEWVVEKLLV